MKSWQVLCVVTALLGAGCSVGSSGGERTPDPVIDPNIAVDTRAAIVAETPPPPITGGTLIVIDQYTAIAADTDRDRVSIVDLQAREVIAHVALNAGDQPGRLVEGADGRVHIVLRGSGEVATLDVASASIVDRVQVCNAPRGVAYEAPTSQLHVACQGGQLITLNVDVDPASRVLRDVVIERTVTLNSDLRDVILRGDQLLVSRFKSAELLEVDRVNGVVTAERQLRHITQVRQQFSERGELSEEMREFDPTIAWRAVPVADGKVAMIHHRSMTSEIQLDDPHSTTPDDGLPLPPMNDNPYGGGSGSCESIVQSGVSVIDQDGVVTQTPSLANSVLPVDAVYDSRTNSLLVVNAGLHDPNAPTRFSGFNGGMGFPTEPNIDFGGGGTGGSFGGFDPSVGTSGSVTQVSLSNSANNDLFNSGDCVFSSIPVEGQPIAVALAGDGGTIVQSREPAMLMFVSAFGQEGSISLGGDSVFDTGHDVFHRDAGGGIACASCHAEGAEDGHVWTFSNFGERRTQAVNVGLEGTEPFHWSGDMPGLPVLVAEVFVQRMGGAQQTVERISALGGWLFAQQPSAPMRAANEPAVMRGHDLFNASEVGCVSCHSGAKLTNNETVDVGTGEPMQVPSLVGIAYRAPFIHTGCAPALRDRFIDTECGGGDRHGNTSQLSAGQVDDLVAYLESL